MARGGHNATSTRSGAGATLRGRSERESGSPSLSTPRPTRRRYESPRGPISPPPLRRAVSGAATKEKLSTPTTWTVSLLADRLSSYRHDMGKDHNQLAKHTIESTRATERRVHKGNDLFAELSSNSAKPDDGQAKTWKIRFKVCRPECFGKTLY